MSLPSVVIFYKEDKEVKRLFINCGWICNEETVKNGVKASLVFHDHDHDFEWDVVKAYGMSFTKKDLYQA